MPSPRVSSTVATLFGIASLTIMLTGCGSQGNNAPSGIGNQAAMSANPTDGAASSLNAAADKTLATGDATRIVRVMSTSYDAKNRMVTLNVRNDTVVKSSMSHPDGGRSASPNKGKGNGERTLPTESVLPPTGENVVDASTVSGIVNYATARYPTKPVSWVRVVSVHGSQSHHKAPFMVPVRENQSTQPSTAGPSTDELAGFAGAVSLPPGVTLDPNIVPIATINASWSQKFDAVKSIAVSKLGTPYIWGHNEDRGQYGFDCSNFTSYVYHHALGYILSDYSRVQATSVGYPVPISQMRPGDLLIFNNGQHVGIYMGNQKMIDAGGGAGQVSYMSLGPGYYWGNHITAVKRMF